MNIIVLDSTRIPWSPNDPDALGGGEESLVCLTREFAARGHQVQVQWLHGPLRDAVSGIPYGPMASAACDVAIGHHLPEGVGHLQAGRRLLWTCQVDRPFHPQAFDQVVVHSDFLRRGLSAFLPAIADRLTVIPDGYDPSLFPDDIVRDPQLVLHASSPDRGLWQLLDCWADVAAARPEAQLLCTYGWDLFLACGGSVAFKTALETKIAALPRVRMTRVSRVEAHRLYRAAGVWAYFCTGGSSSSERDQGACGGRRTGRAAVGGDARNGPIGPPCDTPAAFTAALIEALDPSVQATLRAAMGPHPLAQTWSEVADAWERTMAMPIAPLASKLLSMPSTPMALMPTAQTVGADLAVRQLIGEWAHLRQVTAPTIDPTLGIPTPPPPPTGSDGLVIGWSLEDTTQPVAELLRAHHIAPETPVLCIVSTRTLAGRARANASGRGGNWWNASGRRRNRHPGDAHRARRARHFGHRVPLYTVGHRAAGYAARAPYASPAADLVRLYDGARRRDHAPQDVAFAPQ